MGEIKSELEMIQAFIRHTDRAIMGDGPAAVWVGQVREAAYYIEDIVDEFTYFLGEQKRCGFWNSVAKALQVSRNIKEIKIKIEGISKRRIRYDVKGPGEELSTNHARKRSTNISLFLGEDDDIVGQDSNKEKLIGWLTDEKTERIEIAIWGMGGLGKTTLVAQVYKNEQIKKHFDCFSWITVSETYKTDDVLRKAIKELFLEKKEMVAEDIDKLDTTRLAQLLHQYLHTKRYLIVLDDLWKMEVWHEIRDAFPKSKCQSRIIFTARNNEIASSVASEGHIFNLQPLERDQAWKLFCNNAFRGEPKGNCPEELKVPAEAIFNRCDRLPLAIVTLGGYLCSKHSLLEWNAVSSDLNQMFNHDQQLENMWNILMLSFYDLPHYLKNCFLYCCAFPEDYQIKRNRIIRLWIAEGFVEEREGMTMEDRAELYLNELVNRSMLRVIETNDCGRPKCYHMHDIIRESGISLSKQQNFCKILGAQPINGDRRLSIIEVNNSIQIGLDKMPQLRSLLVFTTHDWVSKTFHRKAELGFRLLRVLDLQGSSVESMPNEVGNLFNLRFLSLRSTKVKVLPKSLASLQNLQTLDLRNCSAEKLPSGVRKLYNLRHLLISLTNLRVLILRSSGLSADPLPTFQYLPNLTHLDLRKAYNGEELCFKGDGFTSLRKLCLFDLSQLSQIKIEERAMQSLQRINLVRCVKLKTLPQGIEYLTKLQVLQLKEMPNELLESMRGQGVSHKKISRIPLVRHFTQSDGKWTLENFLQPGVFSVDKAPRIHQPS
ncbi:Disease resistance protein RPM1 [Acorus gramineus]|uniref:Disease resistance protein RPM1 n=1 Tax=Acorus gramineus TaxID=55184 RepID=A0AAV9BD42_ACOGR|nr:Disease resistance protein RPM1 [Acorus gramineus]